MLGFAPGVMSGGQQPSPFSQVEDLIPFMADILQGSIGQAQPFLDALPQLSNVNQGVDMAAMRNAIAMGLAPTSIPLFASGANALTQGLESGFSNVSEELMGDLSALLQPQLQQSRAQLTGDVMENAAALGQTRSSGTVESLTRGLGGLEGQFQSNLAGLVGQLTPALAQAQLSGAGLALSQPSQLASLLQPGINEAMQGTQFGLGLPMQGLAGAGSFMGGFPFMAPSGGKSGTQFLANTLPVMISAIGAGCWIARAVYGDDNPRWMRFRAYLMTDAPASLREAYMCVGPTVGAYIRQHPEAADDIRPHLDAILAQAA